MLSSTKHIFWFRFACDFPSSLSILIFSNYQSIFLNPHSYKGFSLKLIKNKLIVIYLSCVHILCAIKHLFFFKAHSAHHAFKSLPEINLFHSLYTHSYYNLSQSSLLILLRVRRTWDAITVCQSRALSPMHSSLRVCLAVVVVVVVAASWRVSRPSTRPNHHICCICFFPLWLPQTYSTRPI